MASLNDFISEVKKQSLIFAHQYEVEITDTFAGVDAQKINLLCDSASIPGISFATRESRLFGEVRELAYMPIYSNISLNFIIDGKMDVKKYFDDWSNSVVNRNTKTVGYYTDYAKNMNIHVLDRLGTRIESFTCYEVYPKSIGDIRLDYSNRDILKLEVTFMMKEWKYMGEELPGYDDAKKYLSNFSDSTQQFVSPGSSSAVLSAITKNGTEVGRSANAAYALSSGNSQMTSLGNVSRSIGTVSSKLSESFSKLSAGLSSVTAPAAAISSSVSSLSNVLGTFNTVTSALGLGTPFTSAISKLNSAAGIMAVVSNARGLPGALSSVGSGIGAAGSAIEGIAPSLGQAVGGVNKITDAFKSMGSSFSSMGGNTQNLASTIQTTVNNGNIK
jgi:hypothetical protein